MYRNTLLEYWCDNGYDYSESDSDDDLHGDLYHGTELSGPGIGDGDGNASGNSTGDYLDEECNLCRRIGDVDGSFVRWHIELEHGCNDGFDHGDSNGDDHLHGYLYSERLYRHGFPSNYSHPTTGSSGVASIFFDVLCGRFGDVDRDELCGDGSLV